LTLNLVERITVRSFATAIGSGLETLDVKTDSQTRLGGLVSRIQIVKKLQIVSMIFLWFLTFGFQVKEIPKIQNSIVT
jgi:hypothetical protein